MDSTAGVNGPLTGGTPPTDKEERGERFILDMAKGTRRLNTR
jgi:hypothetical protein